MTNPMIMTEKKITYGSYLITAAIIGLLGMFTYIVELTSLKIIIGVGFLMAFLASISDRNHRFPLISVALFFASLAVITELYKEGGDRNATYNHYFYLLASLCLITGIVKQYWEYHCEKRKGGPPRPPDQ